MERQWGSYRKTLTKELGAPVASAFVESLYRESNGSLEKASQFFYQLGRTWAPLMKLWGYWIQGKATGSDIALILRDAKPLEVLSLTKDWKKLYLNRKNCGIPDELSGDGDSDHHPLLKRYLHEQGCMDYFTFVDSGCYGTIVLELHQMGISFQPLFFFSKNPYIPGFLNEIGISEKEGEILNDSLECAFPNVYQRPTTFIEKGESVHVPLELADSLSVLFGMAALWGVHSQEHKEPTHPVTEVRKLLLLSRKAKRGECTGILHSASPEWSKKEEFLTSWPKHL